MNDIELFDSMLRIDQLDTENSQIDLAMIVMFQANMNCIEIDLSHSYTNQHHNLDKHFGMMNQRIDLSYMGHKLLNLTLVNTFLGYKLNIVLIHLGMKWYQQNK